MRATNREFEATARRLDQTIERLQAAMNRGADSATAAEWLDRLAYRRRMIDELLQNRRIEARRKVVDFTRWLEGDGVLPAAIDLGDLLRPSSGGARPS